MRLRLAIVLSFVAVRGASAADSENEHAKALLERDVALGDFGGARTLLEDRGVTFALHYAQEYLGVAAGGIRRSGEYNGLVEADLDLDLEKAFGWKGALIHSSGFAGWGHSLSARWIGDDSTVSNIYIRNGTRLMEAYFQQSFSERFSMRAGLLITDAEFYSSEADFAHQRGGDLFINSDFGAIPMLSFNVPEPIFPIAAPGVSFTFTPTDSITLRAAIYDGLAIPADDLDDRNPHGLEPRLSADDGALILAEAQYDLNKPPKTGDQAGSGDDAKATVAGPRKLGGSYRIGGFYHTGNFTDWNSGREVHGLGGGWFTADQMLWQENDRDEQGLCIFARLSGAPRDRSVLEFGCDAGFDYRGLIPSRDDDVFGLGVSTKRYSRDYDRSERAAGNPGRDHETIFEASYAAAVTPWLSLQPDLQYVLHPAGDHAAEDALVVGLRMAMDF